MRIIEFCVLVAFFGISTANPIDENYNRFALIPNAEGQMYLIDLEAPQDQANPEPFFNPSNDIRFMLYTRKNPTVGQRIFLGDLASVQNSNYYVGNPTRFTVHGWMGSENSTVNRNVANQYFLIGDFNMITVDWSVGSDTINYVSARNRVADAARVVAQFADFLHENQLLRFQTTHFIGHSLGGQLVGLAGKALTRGKVEVVLALDPAGPLFSINSPDARVAPTDGVYVEVIHTNGGNLGFLEPIGQADFYPNNGRSQPGCGLDVSGQCAHERVNNFHAESIRTVFTGHECADVGDILNGNVCSRTGVTARMGGPYGSIGAKGNFVLTTNANSPFSQG